MRLAPVVTVALLALTACGARDEAASPAPSPSPTVTASVTAAEAAPASTAAAPASSPAGAGSPAVSCDPSAGWDCTQQQRFAAASAYLSKKPGKLGVVFRDRRTGAVWRAGTTGETTWTASTIKLAMAADVLERARAGTVTLTGADRDQLSAMLVSSSNDATDALWARFDGVGMIPRFAGRLGMAGLSVVPGHTPFWRHLRCSADDLAALMTYVLERLDPADRAYLVGKLRGVAANQRWGVWAAGPAQRPGNKDGWAQKPDPGGSHWVTHTAGFAGEGERYVVVVWYRLLPSGTLNTGVQTVSDVVAHLFGTPVPAKVSRP